MSHPYRQHIFICTNQRPPGTTRGCCHQKGSEEIRGLLKSEIDRRGLRGIVRVNASGCLDACEQGVALAVYPDDVWYGRVTRDDVMEILDQHIEGGKPVERLRLSIPAAAEKTQQT